MRLHGVAAVASRTQRAGVVDVVAARASSMVLREFLDALIAERRASPRQFADLNGVVA